VRRLRDDAVAVEAEGDVRLDALHRLLDEPVDAVEAAGQLARGEGGFADLPPLRGEGLRHRRELQALARVDLFRGLQPIHRRRAHRSISA
jgi:hypothetical protein